LFLAQYSWEQAKQTIGTVALPLEQIPEYGAVMNFLFLVAFSLLCLLLFPCSFPVTISGSKSFTAVFTRGWRNQTCSEKQISLYFSLLPGIWAETGSPITASTARISAEQFFEMPSFLHCSAAALIMRLV
jgi:hypothetical protein